MKGSRRLQHHAKQNEGNAEVEGEIDFATLAKDEEGKDDGIAGLQIVGQVDGEGREPFQGLNLEQIHAHRAEQRVAEHQPQVGALRNDDYGLLTGEEQQINGDDGRHNDQSARHLVHQHRAAPNAHADLLVADGIQGTNG